MTKTLSQQIAHHAQQLLRQLIATPSVSRDEGAAADLIEHTLRQAGALPQRHLHNVWCCQPDTGDGRPVLLLNAHIDTVRPTDAWTLPPFTPTERDGRLYGLGSNDCGGGLTVLLYTFLALRENASLPYRLVFLASAEEEVSGANGISSVIDQLPRPDVALVGEPTGMQPAIAEKGLMVLDCEAVGRAGHAARNEGVNALYKAIDDIALLRQHTFGKVSPLLGPVKATVTMIEAGTQHNVVPASCRFVVDVRSNECYSNAELLAEISGLLQSHVKARSTRLNSSRIHPDHPLVQRAIALGRVPYGSPTLSDQALMPWPSFKMGPGDSARSHTADEYITLAELHEAAALYLAMLCPDYGD